MAVDIVFLIMPKVKCVVDIYLFRLFGKYFVYASSKDTGKSAYMHKLIREKACLQDVRITKPQTDQHL